MTSSSPAEKGYVCLTDVFSFVQDFAAGRYCSGFSDNTAYGLLQGRSAFCSDICEVEIVGIDTWNYLDKVNLMFNNFSHNKSVCSGRSSWKRLLTADCSSWKRDQYFIHDSCVKSNAQCSKWQELCVCHCNVDYVMVAGNCAKGGLTIGEPCVVNEQCTGGGHYGLCRGRVCTCQEGYVKRFTTCYQGNVSIGGHCIFDQQCKGSPNTAMCSNDQTCRCGSGYIAIQQHCLKGNITLNMSCHDNEQCSHTPHALCLQRKCGCTEGYFAYNSTECLKDNVHVGAPCVADEQCRGTAMSGICKHSTCICAKGYFSQGQHCYEGNVSLGDACILYTQCLGSPNASCLNGICRCIEGYVPDDSSKCIQSFPVNDNEALFGDQREDFRGNKAVWMRLGCIYNTKRHHSVKTERRYSVTFQRPFSRLNGRYISVTIQCHSITIPTPVKRTMDVEDTSRQKEEPRVVFADNNAYGEAKIDRNVGNAPSGNKNKRKVVNVPPYAPSDATPEYGNISQTYGTRTEDIYNHLNEKEDRDGEDNYETHAQQQVFREEDTLIVIIAVWVT
ncbi:uncharacterized protein LOC144627248 isoform X2 [Crassostrea virginica]